MTVGLLARQDTALEEHETSYSAPLMMNLDRSGTDRRTTAKASGF